MTTVELIALDTFGKYLTYTLIGKSESGKTMVWKISNTEEGTTLGVARWYGAWRQYCFFQEANIVMSASCMKEIADFLIQQTKHSRESKGKRE